MKVGLLQCDHVAPELAGIAGDYNDMFQRWLPVEWRVYDLTAGEVPGTTECDAWVATGSHYSVYNDVPWIHAFSDLVREFHTKERPFVGICFGHQMIGHAMGGRVVKTTRGWSVGVQDFRVVAPEPWMDPPLDTVSLFMSCQDQVEQLPSGAKVLASSQQCPVAIFRHGTLLGIQGHPEWQAPYASGLLELRAERVGSDRVEAARSTFAKQRNSVEIEKWALNWISRAAARTP